MKFQTIFILSLVFCVASAQLRMPSDIKEQSILEKILEFLRPHAKLNVSTVCNKLSFTEYNGLAYSGYLTVAPKSKSALGFIFFGAQGKSVQELQNIPTIVWLNGGPGCSSQFGNFYELGPLYVNQTKNGTFYFTPNTHSWTTEYNVIFVDQPVGTGISYADQVSDIPTNQAMVAEQFVYALNELYNTDNGCFKQTGLNPKTTDLFIFGESYAGKYVPQIAAKIIEQGNQYNLKGIGIGDGFTVPYYVAGSLPAFAYQNNLTDSAQHESGIQVAQQTQKAINASQFEDAQSLFDEDMSVNNPQNLDVYNIHRQDEPDSSALDNLFNSAYGQKLLQLQNKKYSQCDNTVYARFTNDFMQGDSITKVEYLLEQNLSVTVFNGNLDLIVPYLGTEEWLSILNWSGAQSFNNASTTNWVGQDGSIYGTVKTYKNLQYKLVFNSGHMVPQDQPVAALDLITNAVNRGINNDYTISSQ